MKKALASVSALLPCICFAHPGHGHTDGYSIKHYFIEPYHVMISFLALSIALLVVYGIRKMQKQQA
jgi:hypothetical protein